MNEKTFRKQHRTEPRKHGGTTQHPDMIKSGRTSNTSWRTDLERVVVAIVAVFLVVFAVLLSLGLHAAFTGSKETALVHSSLLTPIGFGILLALAFLALFSDRDVD